MNLKRTLLATITGCIAIVVATPAVAQFDPLFDHLKCYQIKDQPVQKMLVLDNQFGRERLVNVKLVPQLLCVPTKKSCCDTTNATKANPCPQIVPCPANPTPSVAVNHFKCYKIGVKTCTNLADANCATVATFPKKTIHVSLLDQFGLEPDVIVGPPRYLCAPVQKTVIGPSTTTTSTTLQSTTTTIVHGTTTTTIPCQNVAQPGQAPMCAGSCPPTSGLECVYIPSNNQCTCEIACAGTAACNGQFCPKAGQQCIPNAVSPCSCCFPPGAGPCVGGSECCSGVCAGNVCQ